MLFTFLRDPAGFDKTLRLVQSASQVAMTFSIPTASQFRRAKEQCAYVRRVTRMFSWIDCTRLLHSQNTKGTPTSVASVLYNAKWTMMCMYLLVEMCALPWMMQIWTGPTGRTIDTEANRFWAYALSAAVLGDLWEIVNSGPIPKATTKKTDEKKSKSEKASEKKTEAPTTGRDWRVYRTLVVDVCDLFIPATVVGWVDVGQRVLGSLTVVSTLGAGWVVYERLSRSQV